VLRIIFQLHSRL